MKKRVILFFLSGFFFLTFLTLFYYSLFVRTLSFTPQEFVIQKNDSAWQVARCLEKEHLISSAFSFRFFARLMGQAQSLKAGHYQFSKGDSAYQILQKIVSGESLMAVITVPEGLTVVQTIDLLKKQEGVLACSAEEESLQEGGLFPESYHFHPPVELKTVLNEMKKRSFEIHADLKKRPLPAPLKSFQDVVILASIVEKETALDEERPLIARVFLNRLKKGIPLQADPTVVYAVSQGKGALNRSLMREDLKQKSPYNTYTNQGLPPGPICAPGLSSLEAVLRPASSQALYFVSDGKGGHRFSRTLKEHNRHVKRYRSLM